MQQQLSNRGPHTRPARGVTDPDYAPAGVHPTGQRLLGHDHHDRAPT
jgi:hypothetical protein